MRLADNLDRHKISDEFEFWPDYLLFNSENPIFNLVRSIACFVLIKTFRCSISIGVSLHLHTNEGKSLMSLYQKLNWLGFE